MAVLAVDHKDRDLEHALQSAIGGEVRFDSMFRSMYSTDASIYRIKPLGVVLPRDADDVSAVIELASKADVSVLPRGGGTSLSGQTVNSGIVMDFSKYMNNVPDVNSEERWVRTQPGITIDGLNRMIEHTGLFFTPDPSTSAQATIGGAIGNNSCGAHSILYGKTVDHVLAVDVVLSNGEKTSFEGMSGADFESRMGMPNMAGSILREVVDIVKRSAPEIDRRFPKIMRRVGGYNMDIVGNAPTVNLAKLITGSEGTLATTTSAKLNLEPIPKARAVAVLHFRALAEAMDAVLPILEHKPAAVEHIGDMIIGQARRSLGVGRMLDFLQGEPSDILVVEMLGDTQKEAIDRLRSMEKGAKGFTGYAVTTLVSPGDRQKVWNMRKAGLGLMMNIPGDAKPFPFVEDTAVSPEHLSEYVVRFDEIVRSHGAVAGYYGHASVGCLHIRPVVNLKTSDGIERMYRIAEDISSLVLEFNGSLTGEHGDGIVRGFWSEKMFGKDMVRYFREVKHAFDPKGLMNPGKIFDTPNLKENLRYGSDYKTIPFKTSLDFSQEGGFAAAIEKCNGVGACRKSQTGAMCPSYMATREEKHTTRGRANALRAAISGTLPQDSLYSEQMFDVLDLCLECKSCKSECPSNVDMAKIKYEFLAGYYRSGHSIPLRSRFVANIHKLLSLAAGPQAGAANFLIRSAPSRWAAETFFGLHRKRKLTKVKARTFEKWFRSRTLRSTGERGPVVYFHDTFTNFNHPEASISAVMLLEAAGYSVSIVNRECCGRPMISKGFIEQARSRAERNVDLLYPFVELGAKIVGCEG